MQQTQQRLTLHEGKMVQWKDPDAGMHADGCPAEQEGHFIGQIDKITVRDGVTWVFLDGGPRVTADDDYLSEPSDWLQTKFEQSDYNRYMWYEEHVDYTEVNHDDYPCNWPCDFDSSGVERRIDGQ